jgi:hypothetical protein
LPALTPLPAPGTRQHRQNTGSHVDTIDGLEQAGSESEQAVLTIV